MIVHFVNILNVHAAGSRDIAECMLVLALKWPYRRLTALKNLYNELKKDDLEHTAMMHEIKNFVMMIKKDFSLVTGPWPSNILNIRSKIYKKRHKQVATDRIIIEAGKADEDIHDVCLDY